MSQGLENIGRHPAGYWSFPAAKLVEDIRVGVKTLPEPFAVCPASYRDMRGFFADIRRTFEGERGPCSDSYRLALRALGFCIDSPLLVVDGKVWGIGTLEEADTKIAELTELFFEKWGNKEQWLELANFLERVQYIDESDMFAMRHGHLLVGAIPRIH